MTNTKKKKSAKKSVDWDKCLEEARKVREVYMCPFAMFAQKHGYNLKYDTLLFPEGALEFQRIRKDYAKSMGYPTGGWTMLYSRRFVLPKHVWVQDICLEGNYKSITDKVMLVKFCQLPHRDGEVLDWELIKKPWPKGSFCRISYRTIRGPTIIS